MTPATTTAILMGYDAMRLCMGIEPKYYTRDEVIRWIGVMQRD